MKGLKMKNVRNYLVETRRGDGHVMMKDVESVYAYMKQNNVSRWSWGQQDPLGDVVVKVPEWAKAREEYSKLKAEYCKKYGSE